MAKVDFKSLVTFDDMTGFIMESDAGSVLSEKVYKDGASFDSQGISSLRQASQRVKSYLNRTLLADRYNPLLARSDWKAVKRTPGNGYRYQLNLNLVPDWPVLKITENIKTHGDRKLFAKDNTFNSIEFWAGYRRKDQDLSNYPSEINNNLTESEVPVLPQIIADVTMRIALHRAFRQLKGLIGISRIKQMFGDFSGESQKDDASDRYATRQLKRINHYRFLA